jgi:hypothetical protein
MTTERLRGAVRRIMRRAGLTGGGPHGLRHSLATRWHARGASLKEVADVLGHQDFDTTAIYARVNLSQLRNYNADPGGGLARSAQLIEQMISFLKPAAHVSLARGGTRDDPFGPEEFHDHRKENGG